MKFAAAIAVAVAAVAPVSANWPRIVVAPGPWSVCEVTPDIPCDPVQVPEPWCVWVWGQNDHAGVVAYLVTVHYLNPQKEAGTLTFVLRRAQNESGYSSIWVGLGRVDIVSSDITPLRGDSPAESIPR
jgi:hypothetical protein